MEIFLCSLKSFKRFRRKIILALVIKRRCQFQGSPDATRSDALFLYFQPVWVVAVLTNSMLVFSAFECHYLSPKDNIALRQADLAWREEAVSNYCTLSRGKSDQFWTLSQFSCFDFSTFDCVLGQSKWGVLLFCYTVVLEPTTYKPRLRSGNCAL